MKAKTIKSKQDSDIEAGFNDRSGARTRDLIAKMQERGSFDRAEKLAGSKIWIRNFTVQALMNAFKEEPKLWHVSRYFPQAEGGPLYVDEVMGHHDLPKAKRKQVAMEKAGLRFLVLTNDMTQEQEVEALEKCGQPSKQQEMI